MNILNTTLQNLFSQDVKRGVVFVKIDWPSGAVRMHNGVGPLSWENETWWGVGKLGNIGAVDSGESAGQMKMTLRTDDDAQIAEVANDDAVGSEVRAYIAGLDDDWKVVDAQLMYFGFINNTPLKYNKPPTVTIDCVGVEARWNHPREHTRYTSAAQRSNHPTDSYCDDVEAIAKGPLSSYTSGQAVGGSNYNYDNGSRQYR